MIRAKAPQISRMREGGHKNRAKSKIDPKTYSWVEDDQDDNRYIPTCRSKQDHSQKLKENQRINENPKITKERVKTREKIEYKDTESIVIKSEKFNEDGTISKRETPKRIIEFVYNNKGELIREIDTLHPTNITNIFEYHNSSDDVLCYKNGKHICTMYKDTNNNVVSRHFIEEDSIYEETLVYSDIYTDNLLKTKYKNIITENNYDTKGKIERSILYDITLKEFISDIRFIYTDNKITMYDDIIGITNEYLLDNKGLIIRELVKLNRSDQILYQYRYEYQYHKDSNGFQ